MVSGSCRPNTIMEEDRSGVGLNDVKQILPTCLILVITLIITVTVIPYAFSSVIKQLQAVWALEEQCKLEGGIALPPTVLAHVSIVCHAKMSLDGYVTQAC